MYKVTRVAVLCAALLQSGIAVATPVTRASAPTVTLDNGTFTGTIDGNTQKFLGIPFGEAPVGNLRFNLPKAVGPYSGDHSAIAFGPACPQQSVQIPLPDSLATEATNSIVNSLNQVLPSSEDCLQLNVVKPASATAGSKLPVVVWIFGGGFEQGSPTIYDGGVIVKRSIALDEPVIYVSLNYRVTAFGFLASKEVKDAGVGNLGLRDQRLALRWVQKYIGAFGGDPTKVTIWGESAGSISVSLQMLANGGDTEGLFRAGFMESGSPIPVGDITHGQKYYDALVDETGCSGASDTLNCLRAVPYQVLLNAVNKSPSISSYQQSLILAWLPRADGIFLKDDIQALVASGSVARIPIVNGNCDDEGTLFSLSSLNVTTSDELKTYISSTILPSINESTVDRVLQLYPDDITKGSPFDTGILNAITPQFKRIAAFLGDAVFQGPRRYFLQQISGKQKTWSYVNKRLKELPGLGSAHATDILNVYAGGDLTDYLINFVNHLDPNGAGGHLRWPEYTAASPQLLTFQDGLIPLSVTSDNYRVEPIEFLTQVTLENPI
ncbi:hypothetical protein PLICRDRAFT_100054 [Plicaturopsis crispa FD-325 SS-3]|nr:hypothetical protein PLICRDRAFT_100054 [Plicaturopsis crispa FD-325 SS-3]